MDVYVVLIWSEASSFHALRICLRKCLDLITRSEEPFDPDVCLPQHNSWCKLGSSSSSTLHTATRSVFIQMIFTVIHFAAKRFLSKRQNPISACHSQKLPLLCYLQQQQLRHSESVQSAPSVISLADLSVHLQLSCSCLTFYTSGAKVPLILLLIISQTEESG